MKHKLGQLLNKVRIVKGWPKPGITFYDLNPVMSDAYSFNQIIHILSGYSQYKNVKIAGIEARGFIWASAVASKLGASFIPIRRIEKLPDGTIEKQTRVSNEYSKSCLAIPKGCVKRGDRVVIIDDVLATGNTAHNVLKMFQDIGAKVLACNFVLEIEALGGRKLFDDNMIVGVVQSA